MTASIRVAVEPRAYDVVVGRGLLADLAAHVPLPEHAARVALVTQAPVAHLAGQVESALAAAGLDVHVLEVTDGEVAKDAAVLTQLWERLAVIPLGRDDLVVAVGGGVVGDLAGFLAATWHRGVAFVQVPTTVLAQVDAAVGGKTAINLRAGKNLVGAFHQPLGVVADIDALVTLPPRLRVEGLAEVVKCGLLRDPVILELLESDPDAAIAGDPGLLEELVRRSVAVKAAVVGADEREHGERAFLNLGHTFGHALEALTGYEGLLHGEAVAIGMVAALRLGARLGRTPAAVVERAEALLVRLGLPTTAPVLPRDAVWGTMGRDKKARDGVRFVLLDDLAAPIVVTPPRGVVDDILDELEGAP